MDEDTIQPQIAPAAGSDDMDSDAGEGAHPGKVFDITPDLNISPISDTEPPPIANPSFPNPTILDMNQVMRPKPAVPAVPAVKMAPPNQWTPPTNPPTKTIFSGISGQSDIGTAKTDPAVQVNQAAQAVQSTQPARPSDSQDVKPMRTYESDVADLMSHKHTSTASIAIAENKKEASVENIPTREPSNAIKDLLLVLFSLILIGGGAYGAYYLYLKSPLAPATPVSNGANTSEQTLPAIVTSDFTVILPVDSLNTNTIISRVQAEMAKSQPANTIKEIVPVVLVNGNESRVTATDMLQHMKIPAPDILARSLTGSWMLGIYSDANGMRSSFVVAKNDFFQNSFAGMLQWENLMPDDLKQYLYPSPLADIANAPPAGGNVQAVNPLQNAAQALPLSSGTTTASTSPRTSSSTTITSKPPRTSSTTLTTNKTPRISSSTLAISTSSRTSSTTLTASSTMTGNATTSSQPATSPDSNFTLRGQFTNKIIVNKDVREFITSDGRLLFLYSFVDSGTLVMTGNESALSEILTRLEKQSYTR